MDNNFNQPDNGGNNQNENSSNGFGFGGSNGVNYNMGTVQGERNITSMIIGLVAALIVAVVGVVLYCVIASAIGMVFFIMGAVILAGEVFLYGKITKNLDPIGLVICIVFALIAIFVGTRMAEIYAIKSELGCSYSEAKAWFELVLSVDNASKMEYIRNIGLGYVISIVYGVLWVKNQKRKRK